MRRSDYSRNPLDILIDREGYTCKGCKHLDEVFGLEYCKNPAVTMRRIRKCKLYELKGVANG
jgi:hypothetical protein